jgi:hypothetical protein
LTHKHRFGILGCVKSNFSILLIAYRGFLCKVLGEVENPEAIPDLLRLIHNVPSFHDSATLAAREALTDIIRKNRVIDNQFLSAINGSYKAGGLSILNINHRRI